MSRLPLTQLTAGARQCISKPFAIINTLSSMARTTPIQGELHDQPANHARPVRLVEYRGAETAAYFSDPQTEFHALRNGCGIYDLGFRSRISITGGDRVRWMNGMVTNNIRDLAAGRGVYAFLLNPQGRILGDMLIYNEADRLTVETDRSQVEKIVAAFEHYIIMDDVEVKNVGEDWTALGLAGVKSRAILKAAGIEIPELEPLQTHVPQCNCDCGCVQCTVVRGEDAEHESYEIWLAPKDVYNTWQALVSAGATPVGSEALEMHRIVTGIPLYGVDIRERDLPQETEQTRALNFNKGCYVGQEIVERIRSRGNVHRQFSGFRFEGVAEIKPDAKIVSGEKEIGEITSVAVLGSPSGQHTVALGYIRREVGVPGREVTIGGAKATVAQFPLEPPAPGQD
jgi:folate-binding protein YgfZ